MRDLCQVQLSRGHPFRPGPQFTSQLFRQLQSALGILITDTTGYNPRSNGQVEWMHRDLNLILRALVAKHRDPYDWEDLLPSPSFALRTVMRRLTGLAHYQILFRRDCSSPIDNIFRGPNSHRGYRPHSLCQEAQEKGAERPQVCEEEPLYRSASTALTVPQREKGFPCRSEGMAIYPKVPAQSSTAIGWDPGRYAEDPPAVRSSCG